MPHSFMDRIDDGLPVGADVIDATVEIKNPIERLLRRRDVVTLRAEHDDWRADIAQVDCRAVRRLDASGGKVVADKEFIDNELDLLGIQVDVTAPPLLETQISGRFRVDLRVEIVLLRPKGIGGIL